MFAMLAAALLLLSAAGAVRSAPAIQGSSEPTTLPVTVLPTKYWPEDQLPTYPANISVNVPRGVNLAAFGAAAHIWLGPQRWTGDAEIGADGSILVRLFPPESGPDSGAAIIYSADVGCEGCKLSRAARYFPAAKKEWKRAYDLDIDKPKGLRVHRVSRTLVTYTLPDQNKLRIQGAAFWDSTAWGPFEEVLMKLPATDVGLAESVLKYFAEHRLPL